MQKKKTRTPPYVKPDSVELSINKKKDLVVFTSGGKMSDKTQGLTPIKPLQFYGNSNVDKLQKKIDEIDEMSKYRCKEKKIMPRRLMGPPQFWQEFFKQAIAIDIFYENTTKEDPLSVFVYQTEDHGYRKFIVAHPEKYWWDFTENLTPEKRCAYEVILEGEPCCLYLDLEFELELNPNKDGVEMTKTVIEIICGYLSKYWDIKCDEKNIINLDSTTKKKFSRHLIFRIKDVAFKDNSHVGRLLKNIVADIMVYLETNGSGFHNILSYIDRKNLEDLFIATDKKRKMFIDTAVYTKNRHFRIYKATKWGKNSHLIRASDCKYQLIKKNDDKELGFFLESLISHFYDKKNLILLEFNEESADYNLSQSQRSQGLPRSPSKDSTKSSPYPVVDKFIQQLAEPGVIRLSKFYENSKTIIYDIVGNRFCQNIGRQHKSNGIYWVVDLKKKLTYQKCHDEDDCPGFRSKPVPLPLEIAFLIEDDDDDYFANLSDTLDESSTSLNLDLSI